jgi:hypothetical protein
MPSRGGGRTLEDFDALRARVAGAPGQCRDIADAPGEYLVLGRQITPLEALRVTDVERRAGRLGLGDDLVGVGQRQRDRLFDQHRFAEFERLHHRQQMFVLAGGDDHRIDLRVRNHRHIVGR